MRHPVLDARGRLACYGLGHDAADRVCRRCSVQRVCSSRSAAWALQPSLVEALAELDRTPLVACTKTPFETYAAVYHQHYGDDPLRWPPQRLARWRAKVEGPLAKAIATCTEHGWALALFITAQVHAFEAAKHKRQYTAPVLRLSHCPPNWMSGKGAINRFQVYVRMAGRRFGSVTADTFAHDTSIGRLRTTVFSDEEEVASEFVTQHRLGAPVTWAEAVDSASPGLDWRALDGTVPTRAARKRRAKLQRLLGEEGCKTLKRHAAFRAAFALAEQYQYRLADRIGFRLPWDWASFARLVTRLSGPPRRERLVPNLDDVGGRWWGQRHG